MLLCFGEIMLRLKLEGYLRIPQAMPGKLEATFGGSEVESAAREERTTNAQGLPERSSISFQTSDAEFSTFLTPFSSHAGSGIGP